MYLADATLGTVELPRRLAVAAGCERFSTFRAGDIASLCRVLLPRLVNMSLKAAARG